MNPDPELEPVDSNSKPPVKMGFTIKVLGVGGAGGNAVNHLSRESLHGVAFSVLNTDAAALAQSQVTSQIVLGSASSRGLGAGGDPERGRQSAEEDLEKIRELCQGADVVFVVAGLGGGTGTGASPVIARVAKECGALVLAIVMLPFDCEGARRQRQAQFGLHVLKQASDGVICLPNQKVFKLIDEKTSLIEAFAITNELIAQGVRGIWRLLSKPGLINVDFADLCSVTQGKHSESALITVSAKGEHRVREVLDKLLAHPLVEAGQTLNQASGILVCIAGGPELSMSEVEKVMEQIQRHGEQAHIIMGTAIDSEFEDRIAVTLVASGGPVTVAPTTAEKVDETNPRLVTEEETTEPEPDFEPRDLAAHLVDPNEPIKTSARFVPPAPELTPEKARELYLKRQATSTGKRKSNSRMRQAQLPLEIVSKGRFEKSEPTLHRGEDLDVPTYIRRGVPLN